jgi:hypothetical protein
MLTLLGAVIALCTVGMALLKQLSSRNVGCWPGVP